MQVVLVVQNDRHMDTDVTVFAELPKALEFAIDLVRKSRSKDSEPEDFEEGLNESMVQSGWVYYKTYSCEGDYVRVQVIDVK